MISLILVSSSMLSAAQAVTVYGQVPFGQTRTFPNTAASVAGVAIPAKTLAAYDETILMPPPPPQDQSLNFTLNLAKNNASVSGLSIMQHGSFYGFSIEMSVATHLMGKNASHIQVPFLNLLGQIQQRAGGVQLRLGGNTQDFACRVDYIENGYATSKEKSNLRNPTQTPAVLYTDEIFYLAANISSLLRVGWYLGIPFNDTNWRLVVAEKAQAILADHLLGLQAGTEPDYYLSHNERIDPYTVSEYTEEFASLIKAVKVNPNIPVKDMLLGPSLAAGPWEPDELWSSGYLDRFKDSLKIITMEYYPSSNCFITSNTGSYVDPQKIFPSFLDHSASINLVTKFRDTSNRAQALGKPFMMSETNTATCGGFPGVSDSFGAALWAIDYGLTMAATNFSGALLHVGGQDAYYNPFTGDVMSYILVVRLGVIPRFILAPPTNQTSFNQWTIGAIYYSVLIIAEIFGRSNVSQIVDTSNNGIYTPSYAIYDDGVLSKVALLNYIDDPTGAHDIIGTITIEGGQVPSEVHVKYFEASSVSVKRNIRWAGQTFGNKFEVDGRPKGELNIIKIQCDRTANLCSVPVKAPSFALVFLTEVGTTQDAPATTFETTALTRTINTATVDPSVLATSNGHSGKERAKLGSTSPYSWSGADGFQALIPGISILLAMFGAGVVYAELAQ